MICMTVTNQVSIYLGVCRSLRQLKSTAAVCVRVFWGHGTSLQNHKLQVDMNSHNAVASTHQSIILSAINEYVAISKVTASKEYFF